MSRVRHAENARREAGFTMIEILVVLLLTGVIVSTMATLASQWLRSWDRGASSLQRVEMLSVGMDRLARDVQSAVALPPIVDRPWPTFIGNSKTILFVHPPIDRRAPRGLEIVHFFPASDGALMRARAGFEFDRPIESPGPRDAAVVLQKPYTATFDYLDERGEWLSDWRRNKPPSAVRVALTSSGSSAPALSTVISILADLPAVCATAKTYTLCREIAEKPRESKRPGPAIAGARGSPQ
jgi:general secretion pathway protein J